MTLRLCLSGRYSAQDKFNIFMRHRYSSCVEVLLDLLDPQHHPTAVSGTRPALLGGSHPEPLGGTSCCPSCCLQETVLCCLMEMAAAEGKQPPLDQDQDQDLDWSEHFSFPRELIRVGPRPGRAAGAHPLGGVGGVPKTSQQGRESLRSVYLSVFPNAPTFVGHVMSLSKNDG